ncbi:hypothetical protein C8Q74DRAFT_1219678 [Fomes fomentarius]|nr:hypothetical protein C8Q74DRAFT_1219678 [Fomes fomentarius]
MQVLCLKARPHGLLLSTTTACCLLQEHHSNGFAPSILTSPEDANWNPQLTQILPLPPPPNTPSSNEKCKDIKKAYEEKVLVNRAEVLDVHFIPSSKGPSTVKQPLFTSRSLLGHYTWLWLVAGTGNVPMIPQVAWRMQNRLPEIMIYDKIKQAFDHQLQRLEAPRCDTNKVLHRVALAQVGKLIWEYETPTELLKALLSVLDTLDKLDAKKILHRDISMGNVLIRVTPVYAPATAGKEEFSAIKQWQPTQALLTDFEFASLPHKTTKDMSCSAPVPRSPAIPLQEQEQYPFHYTPENGLSGFVPPTRTRHLFKQVTVPVPPNMVAGDSITGTTLFLLLELLSAIRSGIPCTRTFVHNVKSTAWVFLYAVYRKAHQIHHDNQLRCPHCSTLRSKAAWKEFLEKLDAEFSSLFQASGVVQLLQSR